MDYRVATVEFLTGLSEIELQGKVIEPLLRVQGFRNVRDVSGPNEEGRDLVAIKEDLGRPKLYAIQIKKFKFSGKIGQPNSLVRVVEQLKQMMQEPAVDPSNNIKRKADRGVFITPFSIKRHVLYASLEAVRELERREVTIIDGPILADLVVRYLPDLVLRESIEYQYRLQVARAANVVRESGAFGLAEQLTLDSIYIDVGLLFSDIDLADIPRTKDLPGPMVVIPNLTELETLRREWSYWSRAKPRIWQPPRRAGAASREHRSAEIDVRPLLSGVREKVKRYVSQLSEATEAKDASLLNRLAARGVELKHRAQSLSRIEVVTDIYPNLSRRTPRTGESIVGRLRVEELTHIRHPLFITGEPGSGKTTLLRRICQSMARKQEGHLPILVYLLHVEEPTMHSLLRSCVDSLSSRGFKISEKMFQKRLRAGRFRLLFDGLDEKGSEAEKLFQHIIRLSLENRRSPVVVSCRSSFPYSDWARAFHLHMALFSEDDLDSFIERWFDSQPSSAVSLKRWLRLNTRMARAARTPIMAALLCSLHHADTDLPTTEVELYEGRFDLLLGRWERAKGITPLSRDNRRRYWFFLMYLAFSLQDRQTRYCNPRLATSFAEKYYSKRFHRSPQVLVEDCIRRGALIRMETGDLSFGHLTYQEFLAGRWLAQENPVDFICQKLDVPWWLKSLEFYSAIKVDISSLVSYVLCVLTKKEKVDLHILLKLVQMAPLTERDAILELKARRS
ncbi:MAG: NACHT domain-containing protein [Proteobacteria bacterium]|nr:NACHT domain-containing protein [Pseudomonadota bacterium]